MTSTIRRIWRRAAVIGTALILLMPAPAFAQVQQAQPTAKATNSALQVSPAIIERVLDPGKPTPFSVQVKNITNFPLPIKGFVRDMNPEAAKLPEAERERLDASKWFTVTDPDFILQPGQVRTIQGVITAPIRVTPGGHYATIFFQPLVPDVALSPTMAYISASVGVLAFLIVKGDLRQALRISSPLTTDTLRQHGPIDFSFTIHNPGNVHVLPTGFLRLYNWRGKEIAKQALPPGVVLPGTSRSYTMQWKTDAVMGAYNAELDVTYGDDHTALQSKMPHFFIIPWVESAIVLSIAATWLFIKRKTRRRWGKAWRAFNGR